MKVNNIWVQCKITQETKVINGGIESNKIYHKLITAWSIDEAHYIHPLFFMSGIFHSKNLKAIACWYKDQEKIQ